MVNPADVPIEVSKVFDTILVLDFGSQYSHLITRRLREFNVYAEMLPCTQKISELTWKPKGIILSGGPYSVYEDGSPHVDHDIFKLNVPILGICYGMQELAWINGKGVARGDKREYGPATLNVEDSSCSLFKGVDHSQVWMSHGDKLHALPTGFKVVATSDNSPFAAISNEKENIFGIQFHPEVTHTKQGKVLLRNFAIDICQASNNWTMENFIDTEIARIQKLVGPTAEVIGAVSGGVDSTVGAKIMKEAIGDRFHAIYVDNGLMRLNETEQVYKTLTEGLGINLTVVDATDLFLGKLQGVTDPEKKRKIIGNNFIHVFEAEAAKIKPASGQEIEYLLQGTLYPDVIESISFKGPSQTIKTHHNVGGLLEDMKLKLIEPLRELFKDEVRHLGEIMGVPHDLVWRHPFPGPGLAIRVLGEVTREQLKIAREADNIFIEEIRKAGLYKDISQAFAALLPVKSVGVMGDQRTYEQVIALRAIETTDFMTADWFVFEAAFLKKTASRIVNEVDGVARVTYDITSKPPATVEWE
ncbi:DEHA2F11110p [Debaryomyces hansenii CBS767]|jgi:GMP synthase (glutamine-hydrolysing)|uniref:GMP synthase [glutamine-hydrolyzing] n=1 Tax=Debaryomyces hansenii (strain ATCC 36239 / CBS 767 / BCRC 21394 / JCM 1990 / NBRC 0083 / IGC 2968) TaxID=284592 RepID=GUAA_DEBHA|nr:DEHA2F11110p [Debaryomyces hansenii CBS767]Q6BLS3.1 RecName: Full=GMP synthase [glutamine-hydrolyzing]; AltName: Full=GMP synthetase; AltName: Full=Glutamine amidotransferase [Debaryomyces hansenii CBS767]CAG89193.1 DEHA2F11110p [Debaryomyces hansenii CBS767]|eukprot:XP_460848.1 DEHA2F11110p [Debaryomyces hansenii CBS767]